MTAPKPLSVAYSQALEPSGERSPARADDALEEALSRAVERGRAAWPGVDVVPTRFAAYLGARATEDELATARVEDLWVACACMDTSSPQTQAAAIAQITARYFGDVERALRKMNVHASRIDELLQVLRHTLFVGDPAKSAPPRIGDYRGAGELRAWIRVTATRAALKMIRRDGREVNDYEALLEASTGVDDPELSYMKSAYRAVFKEAFQEALDSLEPRARLLLKQQVVDGLSIDDIGALYDAHRATAARWLSAAREDLLARTKRAFMERARLTNEECESVMRLVRSQLDLSIRRRLSG